MSQEQRFGHLTGDGVGIILKELVRRAATVAGNERFIFEVQTKTSYAGVPDGDLLTSADRKAQQIYLRSLGECFPQYGIIAEEDELRIESKNGMYFTIDPIDGTKAFVRLQSHGVSTMIALVADGQVASAFIGDINTGEIFGYRPGSSNVWRINNLDNPQRLLPRERIPSPGDCFALLRDPPEKYMPDTRDYIARFKGYEVMGSSIGTWAARLWKGEVHALFLTSGYETPWDSTPIIGISKKLGYEFYRPYFGHEWISFDPELPTEKKWRDEDMIIM